MKERSRHRYLRSLRPVVAVLLTVALPLSGQQCSSECLEAVEQVAQLEKSIKRYLDIKAANVEFISQLDPDQESKRLKASSNVRIAEKRIIDAQLNKESLEQLKRERQCNTCG